MLQNIANWLSLHLFPCFFQRFFGIDCPFCGFQRSVIAFFQGDIVKSVTLFPALIPILITGIFSVFYYLFPNSKMRRLMNYLLIIDVTILTINWIIKLILCVA
jgi:hypothetical protein